MIVSSLFTDLFNFDAVTDADGFTSFGGLKGRAQPKQDPPVERDLSLTLEEVFNGSVKKMKISRKVLCDMQLGSTVIRLLLESL